jgi:hypothetical protein
MKVTLEEIAPDWLEETTTPFPVFALSEETFRIVEATDPCGGTFRFLVPVDAKGGLCYYLRRP